MAQASITLKLTPQEYDVLRRELQRSATWLHEQVGDRQYDSQQRDGFRKQEAEVRLLLTSMGLK